MANSLNYNELNNTRADNGNVKLSLKEKISYGIGDIGNGMLFDVPQLYLTKFFIDVCGMSAVSVAGIFSITKIFDAFMDPVAGSIIDSRETNKAGKFRPVMIKAAIILAILTVVTFIMPEVDLSTKVIYGYATYMAWGIAYAFTNVSYGSLASVMTRDIMERSQLATLRQAGSLGAQLITGVAFVPIITIFASPRVGYPIAAILLSVVGIFSLYICFKNTKEHVVFNREGTAEQATPKDYVRIVFTNKPLLCLILMQLFTISAMNTNNQMMIFFCQYNLNDIFIQPKVNAIMIGCSVVGVFSIPYLVMMFGKKKTAMMGFIIGIIANGLNFIIPTNATTFTILVTVGYVALAIPNGITWAFVSDAIDYGHWHTGIRKEAVTYAAFNFARKIAQSIAAIVSAGALTLTGYVANIDQSKETLFGIKFAMTLYPAVALVMAAVIVGLLHNLSEDKYRQIAKDLQNGRWEHGNL